jgi:hypothetical protein
MPIRVKNVAQGFYNSTGFHPIRSSWDYDPDRAGDMHSEGAGRRKKRAKAKPKKRVAAKRKPAAKRKTATRKRVVKRAVKRTVKRASAKRKVSRTRNPIPSKFTTAKVRRLPSGDIQVLIAR